MKYILKPGKGKAALSEESDHIWFGKCPHCECEFIFDNRQIDYDVREQEAFIRCPHCGQVFYEEKNYTCINTMLWFTKIKFLLKILKNITDIYKNPFVNDAGGAHDCEELDNIIEKEIEHFNIFYKDENIF